MRILFMGTPDFAAVSLKRLVEDGHGGIDPHAGSHGQRDH